MNLSLCLAEVSRLFPHQEALVYDQQRLSYNQFNQQVNCLANGLQKLGVQPGDRVIIALDNCPEFLTSFYAVLRIQGIAVPVNPLFTISEMRFIVQDAKPRLVITKPELISTFTELKSSEEISHGIIVTRSTHEENGYFSYNQILNTGKHSAVFDSDSYPDEVAELLYAFSATGSYRGIMLTNYNLYSNALAIVEACQITPQDRALLVAPAYHIAAQTCLINAGLIAGATIVIHEGWKGAEPVLNTIQEERITFFFGSPTMYALITKHPEIYHFNTSSWRLALSGAASLPKELYYHFQNIFGFPIIEGYGLTETSPVICINPLACPKAGSVGKTIPGAEVKIFNPEDQELPYGQIGEIVAHGPFIMKGYYNHEEETNQVMRYGWFHTGDLGYMDDDGYVYIVDRKKELIIRGGLNIHPHEIEEILSDHPLIFDAAVIGVPDPVMGEEIMAFIVLRNGSDAISPDELKEFCQGKIARFKIPRYIRFVDRLPKTPSGKILKHELRNMLDKT
ncbi:MAG: long-chain fatty acid--CoA ligase [Peptococcaceae bacterium]